MNMLAVRAHDGESGLVVEEVPVPKPGLGEVVVKVESAGLAPGMMSLLKMGAFKQLPTILGHEIAGTVSEIGSDVPGFSAGERVRVHPQLTCGRCVHCRSDREMLCAQYAMIGHAAFSNGPLPLYERYHDGGLAEYVRVPHWLVDRLPENVSFDVGAKMHDLANAVRILKVAELPRAATVVITAATGTMGTATVKFAKQFGVGRLILVGRSAERLRAVEQLADGIPVDSIATENLPEGWESANDLTQALRRLVPQGVDAVLDFVPASPITGHAMAALATGGVLAHMGGNTIPLPIPPIAMMGNCWRFIGTRGTTRNDVVDVLRLLEIGAVNVDDLITHHFPLAETVTAIQQMQQREKPMWMTIVNP
ncbi:alcohol dehydrogenase catalytic domain-containing protein [Kribbella catacumbae]|uniref:alcohol dehydrogenase catalytic domain-containing protein n=1 Tax=Kribbella catacumbae TaxID=460086 RepID=UPI00036CB1C8|nr:alcohol dehydrogenase catalytic domain-containing protein [Kribbella catacumbae]